MAAGYLLDTNAVIDFSAQRLPDQSHKKLSFLIDTSPKISIINKIELLSFSNVSSQVITFTDEALIFYLDESVVLKTINIRKKYKTKLPDAIIAATAIVFDLALITHNTADFKNIEDLQIIDSYSMESIDL